MSDASETVDEQVLRLRSDGRSYARISRELGLARATEAHQAFQRAIRQLPDLDARRVRTEEVSRLDRLAERVRADTRTSGPNRARQLQTIERMRSQIRDDRGEVRRTPDLDRG